MSAQTPQTEEIRREAVEIIIAQRDHYKALCEELREAVESAQIAFHFQAIRDAQDAKMCAGWVLLQDQMSAALKKAEKPQKMNYLPEHHVHQDDKT
jgi:hypothetical protein